MNRSNGNLASGFLRAAKQFPERPALEVGGRTLSYSELKSRAASLAATLVKHCPEADPPLTAVFAYRSETAFVGVLAALFRGHGYVPLNRTFPSERSHVMLARSKCRAVIIDNESEPQVDQLVANASDQLLLVFPDRESVTDLIRRWPQHVVIGRSDLEPPDVESSPACSPNAIAYLLFTSGSTGAPKGVMVSHQNARHYIEWATVRYQIQEQDRLSQTFDMTFDLSVHDMFVAWERGACVCCPTQKQLIKPGAFINDSRLTIWFSVPSTAAFMRRLGLLKPGTYPRLRLSLFCGEALPMETVSHWAAAAPNSAIENLYGPTELTIACTAYPWDPARSPAECRQGIVPIGEPFEGMEVLLADEEQHQVSPGEPGELLVTGPQVALGYWQDPEKTAKAFVIPPGKSRVYYRTGDRAQRLEPGRPLLYLGRVDNQVKVLGHRVELGEIEAVARKHSGSDGVVCVGWPLSASGAAGIELFLELDQCDVTSLLERLKAQLPGYMVPRRVHLLSRIPLNSNGKYDRNALLKLLESGI